MIIPQMPFVLSSFWRDRLYQFSATFLRCQCRLCLTPLNIASPMAKAPPFFNHSLESLFSKHLNGLMMICEDCKQRFRWIDRRQVCHHCLAHEGHLNEEGTCYFCAQGDLSSLDRVFSPWGYAFPLDRLIVYSKYRPDYGLARYASIAMAMSTLLSPSSEPTLFKSTSPDWLPEIHAIVPMPLHAQRAVKRGFNQSLLLAQALAKTWQSLSSIKVAVRPFLLHKTRDTGSQENRNRIQRFRSVKNAFMANESVAEKHIVLVDDVMTTGATLHSAAVALKKAGARSVTAITMARALLDPI